MRINNRKESNKMTDTNGNIVMPVTPMGGYGNSGFGGFGDMNSGWWIVPKVNLITNIGLSEDSVHAASSLKLIPKKLQKVFYAKTIPLSFPLNHPKYIIGDRLYSDAVLSILGEGWFQKASRRAESLFRFVLFSSWDQKKSKIKKALFH